MDQKHAIYGSVWIVMYTVYVRYAVLYIDYDITDIAFNKIKTKKPGGSPQDLNIMLLLV